LAVPSLPVYGHAVVQAPHLAALAGSGMVFDAAYCNFPICAPSRFSMLSGRLPHSIEAWDNASEFHAGTPTIAHYLRYLGYRTILCGKMHFIGPDQLHGYEERLTTDIYPADFNWTPDWDTLERPHWYHDMSSVTDAGVTVRTNQLDFDDEVAFAAERGLFEHIRSGDERPFCFVVSFTHPHDPYAIPQEYWDRYEHNDVPMPSYGYDASITHPHDERLRAVCAMEDVEITDEMVRTARHAYLGAVSYVDDKIQRLLEILRVTGQLDNTVVILTSDHGDMQGERGLWYKMSFYEGSTRVPLVVSAPSLFETRRVASPVSTMDLLPTLVGIAGGDDQGVAAGLDAESLMPLLRGDHDDREVVVAQYLAEGAVAPIIMYRKGSWKLIHSPVDPDQLFDLATDPLERTNRAADPDCAELLAELRKAVDERWDLEQIDREVRQSQRNRRVVGAANVRGRSPEWDYGPPYDAGHRYIRNHTDLGDLEAMARYPSVRTRAETKPEP
ncbi:MAG TPA: choline-sulfatase, partial [Nocardioides sp.]|uniref:choline-sulfatase n=1 Tax=Nocardioides sp. TaxID=35761 RepID=UPI002F3EAFEB